MSSGPGGDFSRPSIPSEPRASGQSMDIVACSCASHDCASDQDSRAVDRNYHSSAGDQDSRALILYNGDSHNRNLADDPRSRFEQGSCHDAAPRSHLEQSGRYCADAHLCLLNPYIVNTPTPSSEDTKKMTSEISRAETFRSMHPNYPFPFPMRLTAEQFVKEKGVMAEINQSQALRSAYLNHPSPCPARLKSERRMKTKNGGARRERGSSANEPESSRAVSFQMNTQISDVPRGFKLTKEQHSTLKSQWKRFDTAKKAKGTLEVRVIQNEKLQSRSANYYELEVKKRPPPSGPSLCSASVVGALPPVPMLDCQNLMSTVKHLEQEQECPTESGFLHPSRRDLAAIYGPCAEDSKEQIQEVPRKETGGNREPLGRQVRLGGGTQLEAHLQIHANKGDDSSAMLGCVAAEVAALVEEGARAAQGARSTPRNVPPPPHSLELEKKTLEEKVQQAGNSLSKLMNDIQIFNARLGGNEQSEVPPTKRQRVEPEGRVLSSVGRPQDRPTASQFFDYPNICSPMESAKSNTIEIVMPTELDRSRSTTTQPDNGLIHLKTDRKRKSLEAFADSSHTTISCYDSSPNTSKTMCTNNRWLSYEERSAITADHPWLENLSQKIVEVEKQLDSLAQLKKDVSEVGGKFMKQFVNVVTTSGLSMDGTLKATTKIMEERRAETFHQRLNSLKNATNVQRTTNIVR